MKKSLIAVTFLTIIVLLASRAQISQGTNAAAAPEAPAAAEPQRQAATADLDATKVDPKHYKLEFENESIRVIRITYGPHEKSPMHRHPATVAIALKSGPTRATFPDGKSVESKGGEAPGTVGTEAAVTHSVENLGQPFEAILIELKGKEKP